MDDFAIGREDGHALGAARARSARIRIGCRAVRAMLSPVAQWHRRWLLDQLDNNPGDFVLGQVIAADGWRGWATGRDLRAGYSPTRLRRTLDGWHLQWFLAKVDAMVVAGQWEFREEGGDIVVRTPDEPSP